MKKVRYLNIQFHNRLSARELPYFRAAVIEHSQRLSSLFHNHTKDGGYIYRYPLIQYKRQRGRAAMVCLEQGADDIHLLFQQPDLELKIGRRVEPFSIDQVKLYYFNLQVWKDPFYYQLDNWIGLNQKNYQEYQKKSSTKEKVAFLERIITGYILGMASGLGWTVEERIETRIQHIHSIRPLFFKRQKVMGFTLDFCTNVSLPHLIGLGKGSSIGFGLVKRSSGPGITRIREIHEANG